MNTDETDGTLVPRDVAASPIDQLPCYAGVPVEIINECEYIHSVARVVRLEALRRVQTLLAPYGQFGQWCRDHDENYGSVQDALSQAYGNVSRRTVKENLIGGLLAGPAETEAQVIIRAQAERVRVLEAQVAAYEGRSAAAWAAEARQQEEAAQDLDREFLCARYSAQFLREHPLSEDGADGQVPAEAKARAADALGRMGLVAHHHLSIGFIMLHFRWKQYDLPALLDHFAEGWLGAMKLPITEVTRAGAVKYWEWAMARAEDYGLDTTERREAFGRCAKRPVRMSMETEIISVVNRERAIDFVGHSTEVWLTLARACGQEWAMDDASDAPEA